jgi:sulfatase maturation enzyme AslB (radical SAM superfamily)
MVASMREKLRRYAKKARIIYTEKGNKGLYDAVAAKAMHTALLTIYKNHLLRRMHHPKLKMAYLQVTNKCNLRCEMCVFQHMLEEKNGYMPKKSFESYVNQLSDIGLDTLCLQLGGESLMHPDFKDFLKYAIHKRDQTGKIGSVTWNTNGMLFNRSVADLVVDLKVDSVSFSLDGIGQVNDKIRLGSKYSVIEENIKYLLEKRGNAKKPLVQLHIVDYEKTEEQIMEFYREWVHLVDKILLLPMILPDNTIQRRNGDSQSLKTISPPFCNSPFMEIVIRWDGKITCCCLDYAFMMALGDATKESLKRIWGGLKWQELREAALTNAFPVGSPCFRCELRQVSFEPRTELILDGKAKIEYSHIYRNVRKAS